MNTPHSSLASAVAAMPGTPIKRTRSICPECLQSLDAEVIERDGQVWMDKRCPEHGEFSALLAADARHYYRSAPVAGNGGACCGGGCGPATTAEPAGTDLPWSNHSCTVLIEIIERCNLSCPTCFAGSTPQHAGLMTMAEFTERLDRLAAGGKRDADMLQLSGGEPTIHPDLADMVDAAFARGFRQVTINSNGIRLARADYVAGLAERVARHAGCELYIYLQFDGFDADTHAALRGRDDLLEIKRRALEQCHVHGISVHPVMTLTRGINDHEVGDFVRLAVEQAWIKNVVIQPAMYSGRYDHPRRVERLTLADAVRLVCEQTGEFAPEDFGPIPCSDPNCFGMAVALRTRTGLLPVSRLFPRHEDWTDPAARDLIERVTDTLDGPAALSEAFRWAAGHAPLDEWLSGLADEQVDELLDLVGAAQRGDATLWDRLLTISIKPFMDAWTYDQDRIDQCCVHILDPEGQPVSFCEYNAIHRPRIAHTPTSYRGDAVPVVLK
ncbi:MAG: radical SAM protein [Xanthomonadales bacterium]|nr:radical SAM protein [Xanthomonadales bacterium]